jgi:hypothetical protein
MKSSLKSIKIMMMMMMMMMVMVKVMLVAGVEALAAGMVVVVIRTMVMH